MPERRQLPPTHRLAYAQRPQPAAEVQQLQKPQSLIDRLGAEIDAPVIRPELQPGTIDKGSYRYRYNELIKAIHNLHAADQSHLDDGWC